MDAIMMQFPKKALIRDFVKGFGKVMMTTSICPPSATVSTSSWMKVTSWVSQERVRRKPRCMSERIPLDDS